MNQCGISTKIKVRARRPYSRISWAVAVCGICFFGLNVELAQATSKGTWAKDTRVSSDDVLSPSQSFRVIARNETQTLRLLREVLKQDLGMAVAPYQADKHLQVAETTHKTMIPEIAGMDAQSVFEEKQFMFFLEVKLKSNGDKTKIILIAHPIYHVETRHNPKKNTVEIKVESDASQVVSMGPVFLVPVVGSDTETNALPNAAARGAQVVRACMYFLDKRLLETAAND